MKVRRVIWIIAISLLLSPIIKANSSNYTSVLDVDLSVKKSDIFSSVGGASFLKLSGTSNSDYIFTERGLWLKQKSDILVPIILTGDFEIEITIYTVGIIPVLGPLAAIRALFPVAKEKVDPQYYNIELWPYAVGTTETLEKKITSILATGSSASSSSINTYAKGLPYRITIAKEESSLSYYLASGYTSLNRDYFYRPFAVAKSSSDITNALPIELIEDGIHSIIIKKEGSYFSFTIDGISYDPNARFKAAFDPKSANLLFFKGSMQQGMLPSLTEAVYLKSIKIVAPEGTFFSVQDVIEAQKN